MRIVNFKDYRSTAALDQAFGSKWVYVGRHNSGAGLPSSPLANPFKVSSDLPREAAIEAYRHWLWQRIQAGDAEVLAVLRTIDDDSVLVCWCSPKPCHAEVIARAAVWLRKQK